MSRIFRIADLRSQNDVDGTDDLVVVVAGGVLAIPVTHAMVQKTTGGVEALTLADGEPGQVLNIYATAAAGDGTLTPATSTGFATLVFGEDGDQCTLLYVNDTIGWIVIGATGVAAPPVISI